ncbi:hypothetical protein, partial [Peptoniphilus senegalensis]|uniref:hypothetical protein n=1 Tax=Peptoniphilus senegalensis TaxID=1465757 RepID=UPI001CA33F9C
EVKGGGRGGIAAPYAPSLNKIYFASSLKALSYFSIISSATLSKFLYASSDFSSIVSGPSARSLNASMSSSTNFLASLNSFSSSSLLIFLYPCCTSIFMNWDLALKGQFYFRDISFILIPRL